MQGIRNFMAKETGALIAFPSPLFASVQVETQENILSIWPVAIWPMRFTERRFLFSRNAIAESVRAELGKPASVPYFHEAIGRDIILEIE